MAASSSLALQNWQLLHEARQRGHDAYVEQALRLEQYYLGGGLQWDPEDRAFLEREGRPCIEINQIWPAIHNALGHQIHNRMDMAFRPRGGEADGELAEVLSKVAMQVADRQQLHWLETQCMADGLIQQRGYFDVRMDFNRNVFGEAQVEVLDPLDVVPDPDGRDYDPDRWRRVLLVRWLTLDEIGQRYGEAAQRAVASAGTEVDGQIILDYERRNRFGSGEPSAYGSGLDPEGERIAVIERQEWRLEPLPVLVSPLGDVEVASGLDASVLQARLAEGYRQSRRLQRRVRWIVTARTAVLHDDWSPYPWFTIVPYYPYFRRGVTRGMIDNARSPQDLLNKAVSQHLHILNSSANSGWIVEQGSLANYQDVELPEVGAQTGLVLVVKPGRNPPQKILPTAVPPGIDQLIQMGQAFIADTTGINPSLQGEVEQGQSGVSLQSQQFMGLTQLALPLDNLNRTRHLIARRLLDLIQAFYTQERLFRISETDAQGSEVSTPLVINQFDPALGRIVNDVTIGEYDVVITEQPNAVTYAESQFSQALELVKLGVPIPPDILIQLSTLTRKREIIERLQQAQQTDPLTEARVQEIAANVALKQAQADKVQADTSNARIEAQYGAVQAAQTVATVPGVAPVADAMLRSAGYQDADAAPIVPAPAGPGAPAGPATLPASPNPLTPANPGVGLHQGIETPAADGVRT